MTRLASGTASGFHLPLLTKQGKPPVYLVVKDGWLEDGGFKEENHQEMVDFPAIMIGRGELEQPWPWFAKKKIAIVTTPDSIQRLHSTHHPFFPLKA